MISRSLLAVCGALLLLLPLVVHTGLAHAQVTTDWQPTAYTDPVSNLWVLDTGSVLVTSPSTTHPRTDIPYATLSRSDDGGASWSSVAVPSDLAIEAVDLTNPAAMFAAGVDGLHRSADGGQSWRLVLAISADAGPVTSVVISHSAPNLIFAVVGHSALYRSRDAGVSWSPLHPPLPPAPACGLVVDALEADPVYPERVFYSADCVGSHGTYSGIVATSRDAGTTWITLRSFGTTSSSGTDAFSSFVQSFSTAAMAAPDRVYATAYTGNGTFVTRARSDDGGLTWTRQAQWKSIGWKSPLVVDQANADHLYFSFGINYDAVIPSYFSQDVVGVSESWDGGDTWSQIGQPGLPGVVLLALSPDGTTLYGATNAGLYALPLGGS